MRPGGMRYVVAGARRGERGSVLVEAALLLPLLMLVFMGIVEFGRLYYTKIGLENATREAARFAVTGNRVGDPVNPAKNLTRKDSIRGFLNEYLRTRFPSVDRTALTIALDPEDGGGPGQILHVTTRYPFQFVVPMIGAFFDGQPYVITYTAVMKNEPVFTERRRS
jgi:hypothetical protein